MPAAAVGTAAVVAKRRFSREESTAPAPSTTGADSDAVPTAPAGVA